MRVLATVDRVQITNSGSYLIAAASAGEDVLSLRSVADFDDDGGQATVGDQVVEYLSRDTDARTIQLADGLLSDAADRTAVYLYPLTQTKTAHVFLAEESDGETVEADVPPGHLWADSRLAEGSTPGQTVEVETDDWRVVKIPGSAPSIDLAHATDGTVDLSRLLDETDATEQAVGPALMRLASAYGLPLDNPFITGLNADGDGLTFDGPGAALKANHGNAVTLYLSALRMYFSGNADIARLGMLLAEVGTLLSVNPGAAIQLRSQLQAPAAPVVEVGWPFVLVDVPHFDFNSSSSLTYRSDTGRYYLSGIRIRRNGGQQIQMWSFASDGTDRVKEWEQPLAANSLRAGMARIGSSWFFPVAVATGSLELAVQERDDDGLIVNQWPMTMIGAEQEVGLGRDAAGHVLIIWDAISSFDLQTYTTAGSLLSTLNLSPGGFGTDFVGSDPYDFGATRIVTGTGTSAGTTWVYDATGTELPTNEWDLAPFDQGLKSVAGFCWNDDADYFVDLATDGTMYHYTQVEKLAGFGVTKHYHALVTLRDASGHETPYDAAKVTAFDVRGRQEVTINAGAIPTGADRFCLYLTDQASPGRTDFHLIGTPVAGDNEWVLDSWTLGGANPPASNTMPSGVSEIRDANGVKVLASDNTGSVWDAIAAGGGGGPSDDDWYIDEMTGDITIVAT